MNLILLIALHVLSLKSLPPCDKCQFRILLPKAEIVVLAEVIEVQPAPGFWSGTVPAVQRVKYRVDKTLMGSPDRPEILVNHYVVRNSRSADATNPKLSSELFAIGNKLVLVLKEEGGELFSVSENCGATLSSEKNNRLITRTIYLRQQPRQKK